jgi:Protein of unknown function (DUF3072)
MTNKRYGAAAGRQRSQSEAPDFNTKKEPDDWVSADDPMTGAHASYLKTLSEECGEPDSFRPDLSKAEASKRIDALKAKRTPVQHR